MSNPITTNLNHRDDEDDWTWPDNLDDREVIVTFLNTERPSVEGFVQIRCDERRQSFLFGLNDVIYVDEVDTVTWITGWSPNAEPVSAPAAPVAPSAPAVISGGTK